MKKSLVALAALAVAGVASAQSSVTLFGVVDVGVSGYKSQADTVLGNTVSTSATKLSTDGLSSSRLGFRGTEDLGGGLAASFWLEAGINPDSGIGQTNGSLIATAGGLNFNRRSTVSLSGAFGEVRLGRDYTPSFWNDTVFDPFGTVGVGTNILSTAGGLSSSGANNGGFVANGNYVRASNSVGYFLPPNLGGFYGQAMYSFNEATGFDPGILTTPNLNSRAGKYWGGRFGYANGPLDVALAYGQSTIASNYILGTTTSLQIWNLGGSYDFGVVKLMAEYSNNKQNTDYAVSQFNPFGTTKPGANGGLIGVTVPVGPGLIRASYSAIKYNNLTNNILGLNPDPKAGKFAIGYVHNLSKRTALYATFAYIKDDNGADLTVGGPAFYGSPLPTINGLTAVPTPSKSLGYDIGIRHAF